MVLLWELLVLLFVLFKQHVNNLLKTHLLKRMDKIKLFVFVFPALEVNFDPDSYTVNEGESTQLTLELSSPADRQVSIDVTLNPDSAIGKIIAKLRSFFHSHSFQWYFLFTLNAFSLLLFCLFVLAGSDYTAQTTAVTFPVGQTSRTVTVATLQDMISESTEEFTATLSNPVGGNFIVGSTGSATISILDDDGR